MGFGSGLGKGPWREPVNRKNGRNVLCRAPSVAVSRIETGCRYFERMCRKAHGNPVGTQREEKEKNSGKGGRVQKRMNSIGGQRRTLLISDEKGRKWD